MLKGVWNILNKRDNNAEKNSLNFSLSFCWGRGKLFGKIFCFQEDFDLS